MMLLSTHSPETESSLRKSFVPSFKVHGGQSIKSDYQYKCLIHNPVNHNVYMSWCTVDYSHRWYWDGESWPDAAGVSARKACSIGPTI